MVSLIIDYEFKSIFITLSFEFYAQKTPTEKWAFKYFMLELTSSSTYLVQSF